MADAHDIALFCIWMLLIDSYCTTEYGTFTVGTIREEEDLSKLISLCDSL